MSTIIRFMRKFWTRSSHKRVSFASMNETEQQQFLKREAGEFIKRYGRVINALAKE